jgi:hypothetical protein
MISDTTCSRVPKRRRLCSPRSLPSKKVKMDDNKLVRDLEKIQSILKCEDPQAILHILRDIAEGRAATQPDGTMIEPLSGLRIHHEPHGLYKQTMISLLRWGVRTFPSQPTRVQPSLWTTMVILDGPKGYNQRYVCAILC